MDQREAIEKIRTYCRLLQKSDIWVDKAFLYGSYAAGNSHEDSDIDVMLVSKQFDGEDTSSSIKAWSLTRSVDSRIEPYTIGLGKFQTDDVSPIIQIVKDQGIEVMF
jgi:uncharacterized protein